MRAKRFLATSIALLLFAGIGALTLRGGPVAAEGLANARADFTVRPGGRASKTVTKPMINSAEVRPKPDGCRNNPAIALTCAVYRIKLVDRRPGYFLRITTSWTARDAVLTSAPDIDTYLFSQPDTPFDYEQVGGASGAMPETIKLVAPAQDEYDFVVGAYLGAIVDHTVTVEYTNEPSSPTPGIPADFVLTAKAKPVTKTYSSTLAVPTLSANKPDTCRNDPTQEVVCDAYRLKLNRNLSSEATNFVVITLDWGPFVTPDLPLPVAGVGGEQVPNLDMYVFDSPSHELEGVAANLFASPERAAFVATQDEYDIVIQSKRGVATGYKLSAFMSDEIFDKPFELLDPITGLPNTAPVPDGKGGFISPVDGSTVAAPLDLAPIDVDDQIAGIGLGTTEQFDSQSLIDLGRGAIRNSASTAKAPGAATLFLALVIGPVAAAAAGVVVLRRRRNEVF